LSKHYLLLALALFFAGLWIYYKGAVFPALYPKSAPHASLIAVKPTASSSSQETPSLERAVSLVPRIKFSGNQKRIGTSPGIEIPSPQKP
jgi:hypothetical protein